MRVAWVLGSLIAAAAFSACGSAGEDLFSQNGTPSTSGTGGSTSGGGTGGESTSSGTGGESTSSGTTSSGTGGEISSSGTTSSGTTSSGTTSSGTTSSSGGPTVDIPCGNDTCTPGEVCCVQSSNPFNSWCASAGQCGYGYIQVGCNGPNDCGANQVCCGRFEVNVGYHEVLCSPTCDNDGVTVGIIMCGDDPQSCPSPSQCYQSSYLPPGHSFCQ